MRSFAGLLCLKPVSKEETVMRAVSARAINVPVFLMKQLIAKKYTRREDGIFSTSCDL
jgi:hypothetical protein